MNICLASSSCDRGCEAVSVSPGVIGRDLFGSGNPRRDKETLQHGLRTPRGGHPSGQGALLRTLTGSVVMAQGVDIVVSGSGALALSRLCCCAVVCLLPASVRDRTEFLHIHMHQLTWVVWFVADPGPLFSRPEMFSPPSSIPQ